MVQKQELVLGDVRGLHYSPERRDSGLDFGGGRKKWMNLYFLGAELTGWSWGMEEQRMKVNF